jgi:protein TonB
MFTVLLESRAPRKRRVGSTVASAVLHGALIATAVALTMPGRGDAGVVATPPADDTIIFVVPAVEPHPPSPRVHEGSTEIFSPAGPRVVFEPPKFTPPELPTTDIGPAIPPDEIVIGGPGSRTASPAGVFGPSSLLGSDGSAVDVRLVDRAPQLAGRALEPRYPAQLRDAGVQGRVVVQFVVDTLGRAELGDLQILESPHALFDGAVRAALATYRFVPGEAGGRKVRTRVQIPFEFTLTGAAR